MRIEVLSDDSAMTIEDARFEEERFITIGTDAFSRILVVVYTWRGDSIRLISARKADRSARQQYMEDEDGRNGIADLRYEGISLTTEKSF